MHFIFLAGYLILASLTYAMGFADCQASYPRIADSDYRSDMAMCILFALFSPISTVVIFFSTGFAQHGLKWK